MRHIHFIGIKGVAMAALAILAKEQGIKVTGSDVDEDFPTTGVLQKFKITPLSGFKKENLTSLSKLPDLVVVTGAHGGMSNPEAQAAKERGLPVLMHAQALAKFMEGKKGIAVAGSHGKTTVAAMIAHILKMSGLDPSFAIGCGDIESLGTSGHSGKGEYFVAEADEYVTDPGQDPTPRFFFLSPQIAVITNIAFDHPDAYKDIKQVCQAFLTFAQKIPSAGLLVAGIDNENVRAILPKVKCPVATFGFSPLSDYQITRVSFGKGKTWFGLKHQGVEFGQFSLQVPGKLNVANAVAAAMVANSIGISWEKIRQTLGSFSGTKRRFEKISEKDGRLFFDDYAHHPDQIKSTLEAARAWFPEAKIFCIFQPHTFSRTKALLPEFAKSFGLANEVIVTDIYPSAREKFDPTVSSPLLVNEIQKYQPKARYLAKLEEAADYIRNHAKRGDIILTMGAGDIYRLHDLL